MTFFWETMNSVPPIPHSGKRNGKGTETRKKIFEKKGNETERQICFFLRKGE